LNVVGKVFAVELDKIVFFSFLADGPLDSELPFLLSTRELPYGYNLVKILHLLPCEVAHPKLGMVFQVMILAEIVNP